MVHKYLHRSIILSEDVYIRWGGDRPGTKLGFATSSVREICNKTSGTSSASGAVPAKDLSVGSACAYLIRRLDRVYATLRYANRSRPDTQWFRSLPPRDSRTIRWRRSRRVCNTGLRETDTHRCILVELNGSFLRPVLTDIGRSSCGMSILLALKLREEIIDVLRFWEFLARLGS